MADFQQDPNSVQGVLSQLLHAYNPQERQQALQRQETAQQNYNQVLQQPMPDLGPVNRMVSDYLQKYAQNPNMSWSSAASAIGSESGRTQEVLQNQLLRQQKAAQEENRMATEGVREADLYGGKMLQGAARTASGGGRPTVKMDKDGNMVVYDPVTQETKVVHSSQGAAYQRIWGKAYEQAVANNMDDPEAYAHGVAANVLGKSQTATVTQQNPPKQPSASTVSGATSQLPGNAQPSPVVGGSPTPSITYKDKAAEAGKKEFATESEKLALKDYDENVKVPGQVAESTLNNIGMLKQIPRTQDMFAPYREKLGAAMGAMGLDGKMATEASNLQQVRPILAKIANDRLLLAKGVQTEGDAQRAYNEFIKITDTQQATDFMYAWAEELANRAKFKKQVYELSAKEKGTMREGSDYWNKTDYAQAAPVAILGNKAWTYTDWRNRFIKANPDATASDVLETWNSLAGRK